MKFGALHTVCTAAVAAALSLPAFAQQADDGGRNVRPGSTPSETTRRASPQSDRNVRQQSPSDKSLIEENRAGETRGEATDRNATGRRTANFPPGQDRQAHGQQGQLSDQALARWIGAGNEAEIRINEFAQQQAESDQVKQFAQKMVAEHSKLGEELRQAAGEASDHSGAATRSNIRQTAGEQDAAQPGARPVPNRTREAGAAHGVNDPFLALHEQIKDQCVQSTIAALKEKKGAEFDHAFMHCQIAGHMAMLDTLKVAEKHASAELKPALQKAQQNTKQHLDQAKQITEQLDQQSR